MVHKKLIIIEDRIMYSLVIAEIFIYKDSTISDTKAYENIYITFNPYSGTNFQSHASISDAQKYIVGENAKESQKKQAEKNDFLKFKYDIFVKDTISLNENTSIFLAEYDKNHNTHSLSKTLFTIAEKHFLDDEFKNDDSNTLTKKRKP